MSYSQGNRGGKGGGHRAERSTNWSEISRTNEKLERYYNEPEFIPEEEKEEFWNAIKRDLPNSFRFTGSRG
jgi:multisite-specific tRNA:(cytosine-C5)-methyltransferase